MIVFRRGAGCGAGVLGCGLLCGGGGYTYRLAQRRAERFDLSAQPAVLLPPLRRLYDFKQPQWEGHLSLNDVWTMRHRMILSEDNAFHDLAPPRRQLLAPLLCFALPFLVLAAPPLLGRGRRPPLTAPCAPILQADATRVSSRQWTPPCPPACAAASADAAETFRKSARFCKIIRLL